MNQWINESINDKGGHRAARAAKKHIHLIVVLVQLPNMLKGTCALSISCAAVTALPHQCMAFSQRWLKFRFWARLIFSKIVSCRILSGNTQQIFHEHIFAFICKQCKYICTKLVISRSTCLYIVERSTIIAGYVTNLAFKLVIYRRVCFYIVGRSHALAPSSSSF